MAKPNGNRPAPVPVLPVPTTPPGSAPAAPDGYQELTKPQVNLLRKPTMTQMSNAAAVAAEIQQSKTYKTDFGERAVPQDRMTALLTTSAAWTAEANRAAKWEAYARNMAELAWHDMLEANDTFQPDFENGLAHDAEIANTYPSLTAFEGARSEAAKRGAETKKANKKVLSAAKG